MTAVIIVSFNNQKDIISCLDSLYQSRYKNFKVILVDNNSEDGTISLVRNNFPQTIIITNKKNYGFAEGNNLGIKRAFKLKSDYIFLLNPDTIIDKNCLSFLARDADEITILQPLILLYNHKRTNLVNTAGSSLNYLGFSYCNDYKKSANFFKTKREIGLASGAGMFIPTNILKNIGLLDKNFFMYYEDTDLCWRARRAGFKIFLIPKAKVWHKYNFSRNKKKMFYTERNRVIFLLKNYQIKTLLLLLPLLIINELLILIFALTEGWFVGKIFSYLSILKLAPQIIRSRLKTQALRVKNDRELMENWAIPTIQFSEIKIPAGNFYNLLMKSYWRLIIRWL